MRTESVVETNRNPPALLDQTTVFYFPELLLENKTSLEEDIHLNDFINSLSPLFLDNQEFLKGANFAHQVIGAVPGIDLPDEISKDTISDFKMDIEKSHERRKNLNLDTDWYVKDPKSSSPEIYKRETDEGEKLLKPYLSYNSRDYDDLVEFFRGFENPQFRLGAFTVFTLKELEAQRLDDLKEVEEPIRLVPNKPQLVKSA